MTSTGAPVITCHGLAVGYRRDAPLVEHIELSLRPGRTVALVGRSGCGKTTLLRTLAGLVPPLAGEVAVLGQTLPARRRTGQLGYVPQSLGLVANATVLRNGLLGRATELGRLRSLAGAFPRDHVARARAALDQVGLAAYADVRPGRLSGGERRRVAIARALVQAPAVLLADEILSELDIATANTVIEAMRRVQAETGMAVLLVEHDLDAAWDIADEVLVLQEGRIAHSVETRAGSSEALWEVFGARA